MKIREKYQRQACWQLKLRRFQLTLQLKLSQGFSWYGAGAPGHVVVCVLDTEADVPEKV